MKRMMGVSAGLFTVLLLVWLCCGNGVPRGLARENPAAPQFYLPEPEAAPTAARETEAADLYYSAVVAQNFQCGTDGVAALELWNTGKTVVKYVQAVVCQEQRELHFEATFLPPGGRALVLEKSGQAYTLDRVTDVRCNSAHRLTRQTPEVNVEEQGMCSLKISNQTDRVLSSVRVYYKEYRQDLGLYIGEVTYSLVVTDLQPGESRSFSPCHYVSDRFHVVAVTVE